MAPTAPKRRVEPSISPASISRLPDSVRLLPYLKVDDAYLLIPNQLDINFAMPKYAYTTVKGSHYVYRLLIMMLSWKLYILFSQLLFDTNPAFVSPASSRINVALSAASSALPRKANISIDLSYSYIQAVLLSLTKDRPI